MLAAVRAFEIIIIGYFVLYNTINLFLLLVAWIQVRFFLRLKAIGSLESLYNSSSTPAVTIVVPAYNEQEPIVARLRALTVSAVGNWGTNRWSPPPAFGTVTKRCRREM